MEDKIDFVITWVDANDPMWQADKERFWNTNKNNKAEKPDNREIRYRDMECLKYWFRGVEKFAPWVNKIYFITYGHIPEWLNTKNEKLVIVNHKDYIEEKYLPTFNSDPIELKMHKIKGLEEKFVYFNDDMFLINKVETKDFFKNDLPCDTMVFQPIQVELDDEFNKEIYNGVGIINKHFTFKEILKNNKGKILSPKLGKYLLRTIPSIMLGRLYGFHIFHLPTSYLKSTFKEVWESEKEFLEKVENFKFRNNLESVNHWIFEYWQFAKGKYKQRKSNFGKYFSIASDKEIYDSIDKQKYKVICINDDNENCNFNNVKETLKQKFEKILPEKSSFEN